MVYGLAMEQKENIDDQETVDDMCQASQMYLETWDAAILSQPGDQYLFSGLSWKYFRLPIAWHLLHASIATPLLLHRQLLKANIEKRVGFSNATFSLFLTPSNTHFCLAQR